MKRSLILAVALLGSMAAHAQLYKWVDKDGRVTYTDQPPPTEQATTVKTPPPPPAAAPQRTAVDRDKELDKVRTESRDKAKKAEEEAKRTKEVDDSCNQARAYLKSLSEGGRLAKTDEKGERVILDDAQIEQERLRAEKVVADRCKTS